MARPLRSPAPYSTVWVLALVILDFSAFALSSWLAMIVVERFWDPQLAVSRIAITSTVTIVVWFLLFYRLGLYRRSFALSMRDELYYTITALCLGVLPLLVVFTLIPSISSSRIVILASFFFATITMGTGRSMLNVLRERVDRRRHKRIAIVGNPARVKAATEALNLIDVGNLLTIEIDDIDATIAPFSSTPGTEIDDIPWLRQAYAWQCERLILTEMPPPNILPYLLETAARLQFELAIAPPRIRTQAYALTLQTDGQQVLIVPRRLPACLPSARLLKRIVDVILSATALLIFSPVMLLAAVATLIDSGAPIFYRQERVGRDGQAFDVLKFRSMRVNAEAQSGPVWRDISDTRTTRVGTFLRRTSIDELPQLLNVFWGDMSMVGPRPERPFFVERFRKHLPRYDERHLVRPGITGWAQIHLARDNNISQIGTKLSNDLFYIEHWSLFMDLSILVKTAAEFLFHHAG
jgi:exopolysaccharide biosynthesis polyprenyl glycosylphosphotransferase